MKIVKTIKLFIGGEYVRTESGRSFEFNNSKNNNQIARLCQGSRKDFRNAVEIAKSAEPSWANRSAFNRSQILYRIAEMMESKREEFINLFTTGINLSEKDALKEFENGRDLFVYYAGFCDKFQQIAGSVNNINGPFHNFTTVENMGVITIIEHDQFSFVNLCDAIASVLCSGNTIVLIHGKGCPAIIGPLSETFGTSDVPKGVINLITADLNELMPFIGSHLEVRGICCLHQDKEIIKKLKFDGADNMKRIIQPKSVENLQNILAFTEFKSVWHPIGV